jgi:enoyl-[acyl-carrier protein] reductase I
MEPKLLTGKTGIVLGVANKRSIAWAIAQAWADAGASLIFSYQGDRQKENLEELVASLGNDVPVASCDVSSDESIKEFFDFVRTKTDRIDMLLHSIAFAPREALDLEFLQTSREAFQTALDISAYSLVGVTREATPLFTHGGSILAMSFYGAQKVFPNYNVMGVAKAALEASVRYLAHNLGPKKIRVNSISAGPVNTLAARGIAGFTTLLKQYDTHAPLGRSCEPAEIGGTGVFLASDWASAITGQTIFVDGGYEIMGMI